MSSVLSRIQIIMEANAANYNNELRRARNHSRSTFGQISKAAGKMALGVGVALAGMGAASIKTAQSFETAMAEVNKTTDFVSENGLANLKTELEDLSKTMPLAFEELASIAAAGGQSGVAGEALADFTQTIAKMSIAFDISAGETADAMAKIASSYEVPIESVQGLGDAINEVSNSGAVKANELVDFMLRVGQSASNFNITGEAAAAMGGALIDAGGRVEVVGTAMSTIFNNLSSTEWVDKNTAALQGLGLDMAKFKEVAKTDGLAAFMMLKEGVQQSSNPMETLTGLFDNAGKHAASLFSENSKLEGMLGSVGEVAGVAATHIGSLDREYQVMANTQDNAWVLMTNSIRLGAAALGEAFLPAVKEVTDALIPMIQNMAAWAKENPELIVTIAKVTAVVLGAVVAVASISSVVTAAVGAWTALSTVFGVAKVVILAISGPIGLAVVAIAALVTAAVLLYKNWDEIKAKAAEVWQAVKDTISNSVTAAKDAAVNKFNELKASVTSIFNSLPAPVKTALGLIGKTVSAQIEVVKTIFKTGFAVVKAIVTGDIQGVKTAVQNGLSQLVGIARTQLSNMVGAIKTIIPQMVQVGRDIIQGLITGIKSLAPAAVNIVKNTASNMYQGVKNFFVVRSPSRLMRELGVNIVDGLIIGIQDKESDAYKAAISVANSVLDGISSTRKLIALFGNDSAVAAFDYDVLIGKYDDIAPKLRGNYRAALLQREQMEKEEQQRASITSAIQGRAAEFQSAQSSAASAFDNLSINGPQTEAEKLRLAYQEKMAVVDNYEQMHTEKTEQAERARLALTENYNNSIRDLELQKQAQTVGSIAAMFGMALGETHKGYKAMFLVQKAYDFVAAQSASFTAIAKAWGSAPFPANIPAVAATTLQTGIIPAAIQALAPKGFKRGGYTGNIGANNVAGLVHGNEFVSTAETTRKYRPELEAMHNGTYDRESRAPNVSVNVTVNGNQSSIESSHQAGKALGDIIAAKITSWAQNEKRPGGILSA